MRGVLINKLLKLFLFILLVGVIFSNLKMVFWGRLGVVKIILGGLLIEILFFFL